MSLTDYNLTPKAKKAIRDAKLFAASNSHELIRIPHLFYGCLCNLSDRVDLLFESRGIEYPPKYYLKDFKSFCKDNKDYFLRSKNAWIFKQFLAVNFKSFIKKSKQTTIL